MEKFALSPEFQEDKPETLSTVLEIDGEKVETNIPDEIRDEIVSNFLEGAKEEDAPEREKTMETIEETGGKRFSKENKAGRTARALALCLITLAGAAKSNDAQAQHDVNFWQALKGGFQAAAHDLAHVSQDAYNRTYPQYAHPLREGNYRQGYRGPGYGRYNYRPNIPQEAREEIRYGERINEIERKAAYGEINEKQYDELMEKTYRQKLKLMGYKIYGNYPGYRY